MDRQDRGREGTRGCEADGHRRPQTAPPHRRRTSLHGHAGTGVCGALCDLHAAPLICCSLHLHPCPPPHPPSHRPPPPHPPPFQVWFSATSSAPWGLRIIQTVIIVLANQLVMRPVKLLTTFPFLWCRPAWRIPFLSPCPTPPDVPDEALQPGPPALDPAHLQWDAPTLQRLAGETTIPMLRLHLGAIAAALDPLSGGRGGDGAAAVQGLLEGAQPNAVTDMYHLVLLSLQDDCPSLAHRFLKVWAAPAPPPRNCRLASDTTPAIVYKGLNFNLI